MGKGGFLRQRVSPKVQGATTHSYCTETTCSKYIMGPSRPNNQTLKRTKAHSK